MYQTYDITEHLLEDINTIEAHIGSGWYKGELTTENKRFYGGRICFSMCLLLNYEDGSSEWVYSDNPWQSKKSPVLYSQMYHGEEYDAALENDLSLWNNVDILNQDPAIVCAQDGPMVYPQEILKPLQVLLDSEGRTILDFGQNLSGWIQFQVKGQPGDMVCLKHAEILKVDGDLYTENLRTARLTIIYKLKGGEQESYHPFFTFQGFRFVLVEKYPGTIDPDNFQAIVLHSEMEPTGSFKCSYTLLNQLHHNIQWGMKGHFVDIPTDCPQRDERLGWIGDAQVFISTAYNLRNSFIFFRKWLRDLKSEQHSDGGVPYVIPDVINNSSKDDDNIKRNDSATGWVDAAIICPGEIFKNYGDIRILKEQYESMKSWIIGQELLLLWVLPVRL